MLLIPRTMVAHTLMKSRQAVLVCVTFLQESGSPPTEVEPTFVRLTICLMLHAIRIIIPSARALIVMAIVRNDRSLNS